MNKFKNYFKKICKIFKPDFGLIHVEIIIKKKDIYLTEIANRGGGVRISNTALNYTSGYNINKFLIDCSISNKYELSKFNTEFRNIIIQFSSLRNKKIDTKNLLNENIIFYKKLSNARNVINSSRRNFIMIVKGKTITSINKIIKQVLKNN